MNLQLRCAGISDIPAIQFVRNAVKENMLSDPARVTDADCANYLTVRGKGWVALVDDQIVGFGIVDLVDPSIWALFLLPEFENKGIGKTIFTEMLNYYFQVSDQPLWLTTDKGTRAETFYKMNGWKEVSVAGKEIKLELTKQDWLLQK